LSTLYGIDQYGQIMSMYRPLDSSNLFLQDVLMANEDWERLGDYVVARRTALGMIGCMMATPADITIVAASSAP